MYMSHGSLITNSGGMDILPFWVLLCSLLSRQSTGLDRLAARVKMLILLVCGSVTLVHSPANLQGSLAVREKLLTFKCGKSIACFHTESLGNS